MRMSKDSIRQRGVKSLTILSAKPRPKFQSALAREVCCAILLCASLSTGKGQPWNFNTIAGGFGGVPDTCVSVDGTNTDARFCVPDVAAVDAAGNVYVAEQFSNTIRKLTPDGTNWIVTTIAGLSGATGSADGTNSDARFNGPSQIAVDTSGALYVADRLNDTIRKVTPSGTNWVVTTIAGLAGVQGGANGTNSDARFNWPLGLTVDSTGTVYVSDGNNALRRLTALGTNWVVDTVVTFGQRITQPDGSFKESFPAGLSADSQGNIFVADPGFSVIHEVSHGMTSWNDTIIAGTSGQPGSADGTGSAARFSQPYGIAADQNGNVYVADENIRKLTPAGTSWDVSTIAAVASQAVTTDATGNVYASGDGQTILELSPSGTNWSTKTIAGLYRVDTSSGSADGTNRDAKFYVPRGIALASDGSLYVTDSGNDMVRKAVPQGTNWVITTIAGQAGVSGSADGTNNSARFWSPWGIAADTNGNLYVADFLNETIRKLRNSGTNWSVTTIAGKPSFLPLADGTNNNAHFFHPAGMTVDNGGVLYVADSANNAIRKISPVGTNWVTTTIAGLSQTFPGNADGTNRTAGFNGPTGIAVNYAGELFVSDQQNATIRKLVPQGTNWVVTTIAGLAGNTGSADGTNTDARFNSPSSITVDSGGNLYVADSANATIRKVSPVGTNWVVTTIGGLAGTTGTADGSGSNALFLSPMGITSDQAGNLFVLDHSVLREGQSRPALQINLNGTGIVLGWPSWASSFLLETSDSIGPGASWTAIQGAVTGTNGVEVTNNPSNPQAFFRLRFPAPQ
jgi:hypothetical protein